MVGLVDPVMSVAIDVPSTKNVSQPRKTTLDPIQKVQKLVVRTLEISS